MRRIDRILLFLAGPFLSDEDYEILVRYIRRSEHRARRAVRP